MFRRYDISVDIKESEPKLKIEIQNLFGCSVSEPSNWAEYGSTKERGLTFLDKDGQELNSNIFHHQSFFNSMEEKKGSEEEEIRELICKTLSDHYQIDPSGVKIIV